MAVLLNADRVQTIEFVSVKDYFKQCQRNEHVLAPTPETPTVLKGQVTLISTASK